MQIWRVFCRKWGRVLQGLFYNMRLNRHTIGLAKLKPANFANISLNEDCGEMYSDFMEGYFRRCPGNCWQHRCDLVRKMRQAPAVPGD